MPGGEWRVSDLGTAAFTHMRGLKLKGVTRTSSAASRFTFIFDDPEGQGEDLQIEYLNSSCRKFDAAVRSLKKLCHDGKFNRR